VHAGTVRRGATGCADQNPEPGRVDEADPVQVDDQRLPAVCQLEQALSEPGHRGHVDIPGDRGNHNAAFVADRDRQIITQGHPSCCAAMHALAPSPHMHDHSRTQPVLPPVLPASAPIMRWARQVGIPTPVYCLQEVHHRS
jgi:hypothetical protein